MEVTGLRNPCAQLDAFQQGLLKEMFAIDAETGEFTFKAGIMSVVRQGGVVRPGDTVDVVLPVGPHRPMERV